MQTTRNAPLLQQVALRFLPRAINTLERNDVRHQTVATKPVIAGNAAARRLKYPGLILALCAMRWIRASNIAAGETFMRDHLRRRHAPPI
jgi:hypothetical protein